MIRIDFSILKLQTIHNLIIDNGMHYQSEYDDAPFHRHIKYSQKQYNALQNYLSQDIDLMDLPMQIINNPFTKPKQHLENKPFYSKNNQSISKCAVTEISSKHDEECQESITPICQKLFQHQTYSQIEKEFEMMQTLPTQVITQATFKPNDLKEYFRQSKQNTSKLKQILKENVFNQTRKEESKVKTRAISSHLSKREEQNKQKTKYERILQEYFNSKSKKETIKSRLSRQKLPNYKLQYINEQAQPNQLQAKNQLKRQSKNSKLNPMIRSKSQKQIQVKQKANHDPVEKAIFTKTFNQNIFQERDKSQIKRQSKEFSSGWMKMSFQQRQSRTLDNRRSKQNVGQKHNLQKQIKQCTFKPQINDFKPSIPKHMKGGSYAKLYYQKIRRRI